MSKEIKVGSVYPTSLCGDIKVVSFSAWDNVVIRFLNTGTEINTRSDKVRSGSIKDPCKPIVYGVGFVGVGDHVGGTGKGGKHSRVYKIWHNMFKRCYSGKYPTYKGCSVHPDWHNFQNFAKWYEENYPNDGGQWDLDKDIKVDGNRVYGEDFCSFVTPFENKSKAMAKVSKLKDPTGEVVFIYNLRQFCIKNNLTYTSMNEVKLGRKKQYRGWTSAI